MRDQDSALFDDIGESAEKLKERINFWVTGKQDLRGRHKDEIEEYEREMFAFLWRCRPLLSTAKIARMVNMSRQNLYERWRKYGFEVDDNES